MAARRTRKRLTKSAAGLRDAAIEAQLKFLRAAPGSIRKVDRVFNQLRDELSKQITNANVTGSRATTFKKRRLNALVKEASGVIDARYGNIGKLVDKDLREFSRLSAEQTARRGKEVLGARWQGISAGSIKSIVDETAIQGAVVKEWWKRQSLDTRRRFNDAMNIGALRGDPVDTLVRRVIGGTIDGVEMAGVLDVSRNSAERLVRTSISTITNEARMEVYQANEDIVTGFRHVSTLDARTSIICQVRDGLTWDMDEEPIDHDIPFQIPPLHWNCRSVMEPMLVDDPDAIEGERASADGPIDASITFEDWISDKSTAFQDRVLGETRAKLWRSGKIKFRDLLNTDGDVLTIEQLKKSL